MATYKAVDAQGREITRVYAKDAQDASAKIFRQLCRRREWLAKWQGSGRKVEEVGEKNLRMLGAIG